MKLSILLTAYCLLTSCSDFKTGLCKKWKLTESVSPIRDTLVAQMEREAKSIRDSISKTTDSVLLDGFRQQMDYVRMGIDLVNNNMMQLVANGFLDLHDDGNYKSNLTGDEEGKWEITDNHKMLCLSPTGKKKTDTMLIKSFKENSSLVLAYDSVTYLSFTTEK